MVDVAGAIERDRGFSGGSKVASQPDGVKLVVFDLAGTTVDHGCFAPVTPFIEALARHGVEVTVEQVRGPMGIAKLEHLRALLALPTSAAQWRARHGADATDADVVQIYQDHFVPLQLASVARESALIPGVLECVERLRDRGIRIGTTTGYFGAAADLCIAEAARQGFAPDVCVHSEQVPAGRPAPWMIFRIMETLGVYPPRAVVKVGDTVPDAQEALNAGAWAVGVAETGSGLGLRAPELDGLPPDERMRRVSAVRRELLDAGAHYVIDSVRDLPPLLTEIEGRIRNAEASARPGQ